MTTRRPLSPMRKLALFEAALGRCHICDMPIKGVSEPWDVEHKIPLALGGLDDAANMAPAHRACHAPKTAEDVGRIAKAKRMKARHLGIKKRGWPKSKWRKKVSGEVVLR
jgi:5-methylcytosine-specific restriction protein A